MKAFSSIDGTTLLEVALADLLKGYPFPHSFEKEVVHKAAAAKGYGPLREEEIREYARAKHNDAQHWALGQGRRFLMAPIVKCDEAGPIHFCGPYEDTGTSGYELGLWYTTKKHPDEEKENFPTIVRHPVQLRYSALTTLVMKEK